MPGYSRRNFLKTSAAGAAAAGAAAAVPIAFAGPADAESTAPAHAGPFLAWVRSADTGEIAVLVGETEIIHHDKQLARRLAQIAGAARAPPRGRYVFAQGSAWHLERCGGGQHRCVRLRQP